MGRTKIDWATHSINPVPGLCPVACPYCYARAKYQNPYYRALYEHPEIRFKPEVFDTLPKRAGARVFVGSTMELFGEWVADSWMREILDRVASFPQHTFVFLSKRPENLSRWDFPANCWVGTSATNTAMFARNVGHLATVGAPVRFVSVEPLLSWTMDGGACTRALQQAGIAWTIIGQQTPVRAQTTPKAEWANTIIDAADRAGCKVFLKDNLESLMPANRQELPGERQLELVTA